MSWNDRRDEIVKTYRELQSTNAVAKVIGCCQSTVMVQLERAGEPRQKHNRGGCGHADVDEGFFGRETEEAYYFAGFLMADGCVDKRRNRVRLALRDYDRDIIDEFARRARYRGNIGVYANTGGHQVELCVSSKQWKHDLERFGVVPLKTYTASIPLTVQNSLLYCHFLRGLLDGDGSIRRHGRNNTAFQLTLVGSVSVVASFRDAVSRVLQHSFYYTIQPNNGNLLISRFDMGGNEPLKVLAEWLLNDAHLCLQRKREVWQALIVQPVQRHRWPKGVR